MSALVEHMQSADDQMELFLWRFHDVDRADITHRLSEFKKFDLKKCGELDEHEAMMLLEYRGETRTVKELRALVKEMDADQNHLLSFIELCCAVYEKPFAELNNFADEGARQAALAQAREAGAKAKLVEDAIVAAKEAEVEAARVRAEELEKESKLTGVAGMSAFFKRQIESSGDATLTNEQKIKQEASKRKELREAKNKEKAALDDASKQISQEEVERQVHEAKENQAAKEAAEAAAKKAEETAARNARKAAMNAKFAGGSAPSMPSPSPAK